MKRIVICFDGTWNKVASPGRVTDVVKLAQAVRPVADDGCAQVVYCNSGDRVELRGLRPSALPHHRVRFSVYGGWTRRLTLPCHLKVPMDLMHRFLSSLVLEGRRSPAQVGSPGFTLTRANLPTDINPARIVIPAAEELKLIEGTTPERTNMPPAMCNLPLVTGTVGITLQ